MALIGFGEVTTLEESQLEELRLRLESGSSRMERPQVRRNDKMWRPKGGGRGSP